MSLANKPIQPILLFSSRNFFVPQKAPFLFLSAAAAAAKSRQSCLTMCDPIDGNPPGSTIPGILQARALEWVAISFSKHESERWSEVAQSCLTLSDPMDCSLPGSSIHGIFQARVLEWVAISFSKWSSQPRDWTQVSSIVGWRFTVWASREVLQRSEQLLIKKGANRKPTELRVKKPERLIKVSWLTT